MKKCAYAIINSFLHNISFVEVNDFCALNAHSNLRELENKCLFIFNPLSAMSYDTLKQTHLVYLYFLVMSVRFRILKTMKPAVNSLGVPISS